MVKDGRKFHFTCKNYVECDDLREKIRKLEALFAGAGTPGEKDAAQAGLERIRARLAELQTELEALRALTWTAVERYVAGEGMTKLASMAKLKGARLQREINDACLQYCGGMGFMAETPVTRRYRDGRLASIGGGADEVMLGIIAKHMGTLPGRGN